MVDTADREVNAEIDAFVERSKELTGKEVRERTPWNSEVTADEIRHFAFGISDDNPLWLDADYAARGPYGRLVAPPAFLTSVLYPILHGAPMKAPLSSLIGGVEYSWNHPLLEGDRLRASSQQLSLKEKVNKAGKRLVFITSEVTYRNQDEQIVGTATGTMIRATQVGTELLLDRAARRYSDEELKEIGDAQKTESRRGQEPLTGDGVELGDELPALVRGPLTTGDLVCWQAGIGPSYRAGALGYQDVLKAPHTAVDNPVTGWPVKYSQQHEDVNLAAQRGMPGPFDNGVMRFAWVSPLITNWMGDRGFLKRLYVRIRAPILYGDTTWYRGKVAEKRPEGDGTLVTIAITGTDQEGSKTTAGEAEVLLPS